MTKLTKSQVRRQFHRLKLIKMTKIRTIDAVRELLVKVPNLDEAKKAVDWLKLDVENDTDRIVESRDGLA